MEYGVLKGGQYGHGGSSWGGGGGWGGWGGGDSGGFSGIGSTAYHGTGSSSGSSSGGNSYGYDPGQFTSNVQENPQLAALRGEYADYQKNLSGNQDADARLALARQREIASGTAKEGLQGARDAGFGKDSGLAQSFRRRALETGQMASASLNSGLTSDARRKQLDVMQGRVGLEGTQAGITQGQQNFALQSWQANQQAAQAAAQLQALQSQNSFNNNMNLFRFYTGF